MTRTATVIGAGLVGLCCARALQREGYAVTVLDRESICAGASFGNAAHVATASVLPQAAPGILRQFWNLARDREGPLIMRPGYVLRRSEWFRRFLAQSRPDRFDRGAQAMARLMAQAWPAWHALVADTGAGDLIRSAGALHVFASTQARARAEGAYASRRRLGVICEDLSGDDARQLEPALGPGVQAAVRIPGMGFVTDPRALARRIADRLQADGGRFEIGDVTHVGTQGLRVGDTWRRPDLTVLAAGAWSDRWARSLGVEVPVVSERGYHLMLPSSASPLKTPVLLVEKKVAVTPLQEGLRLASVAEFAPPDAPPDLARAARAFGGLAPLIPGLDGAANSAWVGPRPSTPDSRPIIGRAPHAASVIVAYGHGHLGLTLAAATGAAVADLALDRAASLDLLALSPRWRVRSAD
jgi:D-amino-acid dehydrogenase